MPQVILADCGRATSYISQSGSELRGEKNTLTLSMEKQYISQTGAAGENFFDSQKVGNHGTYSECVKTEGQSSLASIGRPNLGIRLSQDNHRTTSLLERRC
jgi:hypothetical protein